MSAELREEVDGLGKACLPADALYGIATWRAIQNFPLTGRPVHSALIHAYGQVKLACLRAHQASQRWPDSSYRALEAACQEMIAGQLDHAIVVDALQGGAGTSTNMNVNEVLANRALQLLGLPPGRYDVVHPLDDVNRGQSTNDTYPTALKVAAIGGVRGLERSLVELIDVLQQKERQFDAVVKLARTQLQDAVPLTLGREFAAFAQAFARDRWRIYKCEERLRVVNLGGTAVGTGLGASRNYIFQVVDQLRDITGFGLARAEDLVDATQNVDCFAEVSGLLKTLACNLIKVANDLRWLSSGPHGGLGEIRLPALQPGSSIMPGKVNPVIPEAVVQCGFAVVAHDALISQACSGGNFELNPFLPAIADSLLSSLDLLERACRLFAEKCIAGIEAIPARCGAALHSSTAVLTALVERIGYERALAIGNQMHATGQDCRTCAAELGYLSADEYDALLAPDAVLRLGSTEPANGP